MDYNLLYRWFVGLAPYDPVLGPDHLHEEPRPDAEWRGIYEAHEQPSKPCAGQTAVVGRVFFGGRDADRGLGFTEAFSSQGRQRRGRREAQTSRGRRPPGGRPSSPTWTTSPWRTGMGLPWPAWSPTPMIPPSAALRRSCSRPRVKKLAAASRPAEDKAYDTADHVAKLRARNVTPHVTQNIGPTKTGKSRQSAI